MKCLTSIALLLAATNAYAVLTPVNSLGEWGTSSSLSLQGIIDARTVGGGPSAVDLSSDADQLDNGIGSGADGWWTAPDGISASMVIEVAGFASQTTFGIYDVTDPSAKTQIFSGAQTGGASTLLVSPYSVFGFYIENTEAGFTFYSDASLNPDNADQMVAYQGKGETLNLGSNPLDPQGTVVWCSGSYLLGWEDMINGDDDYNDMVVVIKGIQGIPSVPDTASTAALLGIAVFGLGFFRRLRVN